MSTTAASGRAATKIRVDSIARIEGEGALHVRLKGGRILDLRLEIPEPPRLFEAFLRGRRAEEAVDVTARICGICPVAHQMSAAHAIERAWGIAIDPPVRALRRLLYCGEWIESHALHIYFLHAPDFLGFQDAIEMAGQYRAEVERALRLKKLGNRIVSIIGAREIHPVSARVGGFHHVPARAELLALEDELKWALDAARETVKLVAALPFPDFQQDYEFVALSHPGEYALNEGRIVSSRGIDIDAAGYDDQFIEQHVRHSNALHSVVRARGSFHTGPLARFNLNFERLTPAARDAAAECGLAPPVTNPFRSIIVRAVELVFACEEALRLVLAYEAPAPLCAAYERRAGDGAAATEAPRGLLYHRYAIDDNGLILRSKIVPPTAQNLKRIEDDLWGYLPQILGAPPEELAWRAEQAIRNYDPCISCATHFLRLRLSRAGRASPPRRP
jgi:coenzyme F420-reducing hydrogenase alpha subunit